MTLADRYHALHDTDVQEHLGYFVHTVLDLNAQAVLELGVRDGNSTIAFLYALAMTSGHLWSIDTDPTCQERVGLHLHWTLVVGDDREVADEVPEMFDALFIDTTHGYEHTLDELDLYALRVRSGGRVMLHDSAVEHGDALHPDDEWPVRRALAHFCDMAGLTWTERPGSNGLAVITMP